MPVATFAPGARFAFFHSEGSSVILATRWRARRSGAEEEGGSWMLRTTERTDAVAMAKGADVNPKTFRAALRAERFAWHVHGSRWQVTKGSLEHQDMMRVLKSLAPSARL